MIKVSERLSFSWQATVLEEMPPFPERESSILATLKKKKPSALRDGQIEDSKMHKEGKMMNGTENQERAPPGPSPPQVRQTRPSLECI